MGVSRACATSTLLAPPAAVWLPRYLQPARSAIFCAVDV
jgi:hypothetical protein